MSVSENFAELMDGVKHLHGNLYRVKRDLIQLAKPGVNPSEKALKFANPRYIKTAKGKPVGKGLAKEEMEELRNAIRTEGLENPVRLRCVDANEGLVLEIVNGERRKRNIDKLCKDNEDCYDPAEEDIKKASELYDFIDCRINRMDDRTAFKHSFTSNEKAIDIGEAATVSFVRHLRQCGEDSESIVELTGKSITWVKETDSLIGLDDKTFEALKAEDINRKVALSLTEIKSTKDRLARLKDVKKAASVRLDKLKAKADDEVEKAEEQQEIARAEKKVTEITGGDTEAAKEAEVEAKKKVVKKKKEQEKVSKRKVKATGKDLGKSETKPLTRSKVEKRWNEPLPAIIRKRDEEIDVEDARLAKLLCEGFFKGEEDILKLLKQHKKNKTRRNG